MCLNSSRAAKLCFRKLILPGGIEPHPFSFERDRRFAVGSRRELQESRNRTKWVLPVIGGDQSGQERWPTLAAAAVPGHDGTPGENGERTGAIARTQRVAGRA